MAYNELVMQLLRGCGVLLLQAKAGMKILWRWSLPLNCHRRSSTGLAQTAKTRMIL